MKPRKRKRTPVSPQFRSFNLAIRFTPDGPDVAAKRAFFEFLSDATTRTVKLKTERLAEREAQFKKRQRASRKIQPFLKKYFQDEISIDDLSSTIKQLVPDMALLREVLDAWSKAERTNPDELALSKEKLGKDEADIQRRDRLLNAESAITDGITVLWKAAEGGDPDAVSALAKVAINAGLMLHHLESVQPGLVRTIARAQTLWPVIASSEGDWGNHAAERTKALNLGADLNWLRVRFRSARGTDANLPARKWAKAAVRTIEDARWRIRCVAHLIKEFGSVDGFVNYCGETGWEFGGCPAWHSEVSSLAPFSRASLSQWKQAIRKMIREDVPDFHERPEWNNQRNTAAANGNGTIGKLQNAILDDIMSALFRIAPDGQLPESPC